VVNFLRTFWSKAEQASLDQPEVSAELALSEPSADLSAPHATSDGLGPTSGLAAVGLCGVFAFINLYATQPLLPMFAHVFAASKAAVALTISASTLGVAFSAPWMGAFVQRLSRKRVIVTSAFVLSIPTLLAATSPSLHALIGWRLAQGIVLPGIFTATIAYITEEWPASRVPQVMSIYISGTVLGGFIGRIIAGFAAEHIGWRSAFLFLGAVILAGSGVIARYLPHERTAHSRSAASSSYSPRIRTLFRARLVAVYAVGFNILFALVAIFTYITFHLSAPPFLLGTAALSSLFVVYLVGLIATPLAGVLLGRIGLRQGFVIATALSLTGVLLTLQMHLAPILIGLTLCSSGVFICQAAATSHLRVAAPPHVRTFAAGLYLSAYYLGGTVGGELPSAIWSRAGWPGCVALVAALQCVTLAIAWFGWE
jgi:MFS transporter, YNFM family, putative membrane transport protein